MFQDNDAQIARLIDVYEWLKHLAYLLYSSDESISVKADDVQKLTEHTKDGIFLLKQAKQNFTELSEQIKDLKLQLAAKNTQIIQLEESRGILLSELASAKMDLSTHYHSDRPKHFSLIEKYKTLKEQQIDPLVNDLFQALGENEANRPRKDVINSIKIAFSETVFILSDQSAQELCDRFLERVSLIWVDEQLKTQTANVIYSSLQFLASARQCEPPALFVFYQNEPFSPELHEPARGWADEGMVITTIYPAYLVNQQVKVKALVLSDHAIEYTYM